MILTCKSNNSCNSSIKEKRIQKHLTVFLKDTKKKLIYILQETVTRNSNAVIDS